MTAETKILSSFLARAQAGQLSASPKSTIFPRMSEQDLGPLGDDIVAHGLREPMLLLDGEILDGNSRYQALLKKGYRFREIDFQLFDPKVHGDPLAFVVSKNLHRRHLTTSQRAIVAAKLVTTELGYNQYNRTGVSNEKAAQFLGVSVATVKTAKELTTKASPAIQAKVQSGELQLSAAMKLVKDVPNKEQQVAKLEQIKKEKQDEKEKQKQAKADAKAQESGGSKGNKHNAAMKALDKFQAEWQSFDDMQRKAFVTNFEDQLAELLDNIRRQRAMIAA